MIKSFDPTITTVDAHIYDQLGIEASKRATSETSSTTTRVVSGVITADKLFIQQIFYGCIRYKDFLKVREVKSCGPAFPSSHTNTRPRYSCPIFIMKIQVDRVEMTTHCI